MKWYLHGWNHYADFRGRARRTEYWMFVLFNLIFAIVAILIDNALHTTFSITDINGEEVVIPYGWIYISYMLAVFIPGLAVSVRRLHDVDKSGWMMLINLIPFIGGIWFLILMCTDSTPGPNKWGPNPKEPTPTPDVFNENERIYV